MTCPSCQAQNDTTAETCFMCGQPFAAVIMFGTLVGARYEVLSPLGRGGMGTVYKARDRVLDEVVALKVLRADLAKEADLERRFRSEIKLARKVRHRNVCGIHEYGEDGNLRYIVMEFIEGIDLKQELRTRGFLPAAAAFDTAIQIAEGLEAVHAIGIVHRDLKTPNLMRDAAGAIRLMDFGIAKRFGGETTGATGTGQILGTPEYMSPEQARGIRVDARSDIYAMGIVTFELFTGQVPFRGDTPVATIFKQIQDPPPLDGPLAQRIPQALVPMLRRALAKDPDERYSSATEMIYALKLARDASLPAIQAPMHPTPLPRLPTLVPSFTTSPPTTPIATPVPNPGTNVLPGPSVAGAALTTPMPPPATWAAALAHEPPTRMTSPRQVEAEPAPPPASTADAPVGERLRATPPRPAVIPRPSAHHAAPSVHKNRIPLGLTVAGVAIAVAATSALLLRRAATPAGETAASRQIDTPHAMPTPSVSASTGAGGLPLLSSTSAGAADSGVPSSGDRSVALSPRRPAAESRISQSAAAPAPRSPLPAPPTLPGATMAPPTRPVSVPPAAAPLAAVVPPAATEPAMPASALVTTDPPPTPGASPDVRLAEGPRPSADGALQVAVKPWAEVSVNGKLVGVTPLNRIVLKPGTHVVRLVHPAFEPLQRTVTVTAGDTARVIVDLLSEGTRKKSR